MPDYAHIPVRVNRVALTIGLLVPAALAAQSERSADEYRVARVDRPAHAGHAELHRPSAADAGVELLAAEIMGIDNNAPALCRAAKLALTIGLLTDRERDGERMAWFERAEAYALRARALEPRDPDALYMEASALGLQAQHLPVGERVRMANRILEKSRQILEIDPDHAGGLHLHGRLNAVAMRLNPMVRFMVARVMGGELLKTASWDRAEASLREALDAEPDNPMHRLELAFLLQDTGRTDAARDQLRRVVAYPDASPLVAYYKEQARDALRRLE